MTDRQTAWNQTCQVVALVAASLLLHHHNVHLEWRQRAKSASRMGHHCHNQAAIGEIPAKPPALGTRVASWPLRGVETGRAEWGLRLLKSWAGRAWACRAASHPASPLQALGWHSHRVTK